ncbi:hypothetical protein HMI55_003742, partial [Coelomomyces lativittatus]
MNNNNSENILSQGEHQTTPYLTEATPSHGITNSLSDDRTLGKILAEEVPKFEGSMDSNKTMEFIFKLDRWFQRIAYNDSEKVDLAASKMNRT